MNGARHQTSWPMAVAGVEPQGDLVGAGHAGVVGDGLGGGANLGGDGDAGREWARKCAWARKGAKGG